MGSCSKADTVSSCNHEGGTVVRTVTSCSRSVLTMRCGTGDRSMTSVAEEPIVQRSWFSP